MKRTAKIFVALALLFACSVFAGLSRPLTFTCEKDADDVYTCDIEQLGSSKPVPNSYSEWGRFLQAFQTKIEEDLGPSNPSAKTEYSAFVIRFNSDIDLQGTEEIKGIIFCGDTSFAPMNFSSLAFQPTIDGENHIIKNFCYIAKDKNASFFSNLNNTTVKNITFLNSYVKAKTITAENSCDDACNASVVAHDVENVEFENVIVKNALVYGWQTSTLAINAKAASTDLSSLAVSLSGVTIQDVTLGMTQDVIEGYPAVTTLRSVETASGGVVARIDGYATMENINVSRLSIPDSISKVIKDVTTFEYVGDRYVGGVAGKFSPSSIDTDFTLDNIKVSADLIGLWVGGLFGKVTIDNQHLLGSSNFNVTNAKVTLNSPLHLGNSDKNRFFGGLVGEWVWLRGKVVLSNDTVDVLTDWHADKHLARAAYMGGLVGMLTGKADDISFVDVLAENNTITAEIQTSSLSFYIGGILGRVDLEASSDDSGTLRIFKSSVKAKESNLIEATSDDVILGNASYFVGNAVSRGGNIDIQQNYAEGDININNDFLSASGSVGSEIGLGWFYSANISNNITVGDIFVKTPLSSGNQSLKISQGYVAGVLTGSESDSKVIVRNNIHYGSNDTGDSSVVTKLEVDGRVIPASEWRTTYSSNLDIRCNYRNAVGTLKAEGELALDGSGLIISNDGEFYDGVISADAMKSRLLAYVMNATQMDKVNPVLWENGTLMPEFSKKRTAYRLAISLLDEDYQELTAKDKATIKDYLPVKQCEAGACSLYVYTENDAQLVSGLRYVFDELEAGFMLVERTSYDNPEGVFNYSRVFSKDTIVIGVTDREINVEYTMTNLDGPGYVPVDKYADHLTFVWPRVDKIRLISGTGAVPVILLDTDDANGNTPEYELNFDFAENPCKEDVTDAQCVPVATYSSSTKSLKKMDAFEDVLRNIRRGFNSIHQNKIVLKYLPIDLSQEQGYLPHIEVGVLKGEFKDRVLDLDAKINMTTYAYDGKGVLKEKDSFKIKKEQSNVDMVSRYQFSFAEQGFKVKDWWVDFWIDLDATSTDEIKACYNEGDVPARCVEPQLKSYGDSTKNYFNGVSDIENRLTGIKAGEISITHPLVKWSTKLDANDKLDLDSLIRGLASVGFKNDPEKPRAVFMGVRPRLESVRSYTVNFDVNADGKNVFFTDEFVFGDSYSRENGETAKLPEGLLATDACFSGWTESAENPVLTPSLSMDGMLLELANPSDKGSFDLYGAWDAGCEVKKAEVLLKVVDTTGAEGDYGSVTLSQSYRKLGKDRDTIWHEFIDGKLEVPASDVPMTLHVTSTQTNKAYDLAQLILKAPNGNEMTISLTPGDTSFKLEPRKGESYTLYAVFGGFIDVSINVGRDDVIYGYESDKKTIRLVETGTTYLPQWVYTPTECALGWSVTPEDGGDYDRGAIASSVLSAKLTSDTTLYAVWGKADACVASADYRRFKLDAMFGTVEIVEVDTSDGSEKLHAFAVDSTVLLPQDYAKSVWVVRGVPQDGYKLDSIVIDGRIKLVDGDTLADSITGYLPMKAYFSDGQKPVDPNPVQNPSVPDLPMHPVELSGARNGNAMHLPIEWKVDSGAVVEVRATLYDNLGNSLPNPLVLSVEGPGSYDWVVYSLLPGTYYAKVTINGRSVVEKSFVTESFEVEPEIAVAPNTWRMISLSDVDQNAVLWDNDPRFYYWNEAAEYGVVWKYQKYNGGAVKAQQGVWYNSLEGRPLVLRRDVATGSDVAQGAHTIVWELEKGWNMVANPYGWKVKLPEIMPEMWSWTAESGFLPVTELQPYEAVWLRYDAKAPYPIPAEPWFDEPMNTGALQKTALAKAAHGRWTLQAMLEDTKGHGDFWNVLGVGKAEELLEPPAGMGDFVNLSVVEGKKALLKSIKSAEDDRHEWKLALSATTDRIGYLKFEGVKALNEMGLRVYVTIDGKTTEMGAGDSLKVMLKAAGSVATVQVTASEVRTVASKVENLRFTRVPGALQVGFDVSSDLAGAGYRVQLVGVNGKVAATYHGKSAVGHNTLALTAPKPGLYLLRVTLGRHHAARKVVVH